MHDILFTNIASRISNEKPCASFDADAGASPIPKKIASMIASEALVEMISTLLVCYHEIAIY
jgi:hypothetical protein